MNGIGVKLKHTILIVDDSREILTNLKYIVQNEFSDLLNVEISDNPVEALELIDDLRANEVIIPFVIVDFIMPTMNGDVFLEKLYQKHPDILSILLTGFGTLEGITRALNNSNLFMFISKPWENEQLLLACKKAYDNYLKTFNLYILNQKLLSLDKTKNFVISLLAHELYTPINTIKMSTNILLTQDDDNTRTFKDFVKISTDRLIKIADNALLYTKLLTNQLKLKHEELRINHLIETVIFLLKDEIEGKKIEILRDYDEELNDLYIKLDNNLNHFLYHVIIENSIKYNSKKIHISTKLNEKDIVINITDDGAGFSEYYLKHKFQIMMENNIMNHSEGLGISLAIVKLITEKHNFDVEIGNNEKGAKVEITIPLKYVK